MTLLVCVDKKNGMAFHQRRQSMDRLVRADILSTVDGKALWMTPYSARQFVEPGLSLHLADAPAAQAGTDEFCFLEFPPLAPYLGRIDTLVLYRWDRIYPADQSMDLNLEENFHLCFTHVFSGHSHPKITKEVYER